ncbi:MAG: hypothetical protein ACI31A_05080 [Candidatus Limisoma sp.]
MYRKLTYMLFALVAMLTLGSCLHNNGDIGPWFGHWKVTRITIDGTDDPNYGGDLFFSFQSSVIRVSQSFPAENRSSSIYGNWQEQQGTMSVEFKEAFQSLLDYAHLDKQFVFNVVRRSGDKVLRYTAEDGKEYTYYLTKW